MNRPSRYRYAAPEEHSDRMARAAGHGFDASARRQYAGGSAPLRLFVGAAKEATPKQGELKL